MAASSTEEAALPHQRRVNIRLRLLGTSKKEFLEVKKALGLKQDTEVMRFLITKYFLEYMAIPAEFFTWFLAQPHGDIITLSEVFEAYERFKREKQANSPGNP